MVYDGHEKDPTIEGPKFYKRNGYYYIFAPLVELAQAGNWF
jgi:beta-xylosidase